MFKRLVAFAAVFTTQLNTSRAYDYPDQLQLVTSAASSASKPLPVATQVAQDLLDGIGAWLVSNFELPAVQDRSVIEFVSKKRIAAMRLQGHAPAEGATDARYTGPGQRRPVAVYDDSSRTIVFPDDWVGQSAADKSILVHEMVHHIQNLAGIKYECPMGREKSAYLAQDKWLAQFGLGMRLAADHQLAAARRLLSALRSRLGTELIDALLAAPQRTESDIRQQRTRVAQLVDRLAGLDDPVARQLASMAGQLVRRSVWIVGGDGWAYDIGSGGLDHVLASGRDVNVLVLDTEVYSNTGGQASKATPLGAVAKFANAGKQTEKKDLALQAMAYGNVYVARIAMGANAQQTLDALREAETYEGPALVLAYAHCIAHGIDMRQGLDQQSRAVHTGYWPLMRYNPELRAVGEPPLTLDSVRPSLPFRAYAERELRYRMLLLSDPPRGEALMRAAQEAVDRKWKHYEDLATLR